MKTRRRIGLVILVSIVAALVACSQRAPHVTRVPPYPLEFGPVFLTLKSLDHEEAIKSAVERAGIPLAQGPDDVMYTLRVDLGSSRGSSNDCGSLRDVKFLLNYAVDPQEMSEKRSRRKAIRIGARGYVGDCEPNVFDEMAMLMRGHMFDTKSN